MARHNRYSGRGGYYRRPSWRELKEREEQRRRRAASQAGAQIIAAGALIVVAPVVLGLVLAVR